MKVGVLQSLSGTMAISEVAVRDSALLAIKEINAAGGVLGKQIEPLVEDGESKPEVFATKSEKLITNDKVAAGMSILLGEQYVEFALRLAERYAVMEAGRITRAGSTESVALASFAELLAV